MRACVCVCVCVCVCMYNSLLPVRYVLPKTYCREIKVGDVSHQLWQVRKLGIWDRPDVDWTWNRTMRHAHFPLTYKRLCLISHKMTKVKDSESINVVMCHNHSNPKSSETSETERLFSVLLKNNIFHLHQKHIFIILIVLPVDFSYDTQQCNGVVSKFIPNNGFKQKSATA